MATKILVVDNYDSFVFNLVQYLGQLGAECTVVRNDEVTADEASKYDGVLISPGPGTPEKAGVSIDMINYCAEKEIAGVLNNLPSPFTATRYHSLAVEPATIGEQLEVTGRTESGVVMSMRHKTLPIEGVQFHPESVLTEHGHKLLANWLTQCGDTNAQKKAVGLSPVISA
ncbi:MAG: anthranilate synthase component II [Actinobacteria bacterium]|nr:anthranilate synthase component II [Actinomycetota bacterium]